VVLGCVIGRPSPNINIPAPGVSLASRLKRTTLTGGAGILSADFQYRDVLVGVHEIGADLIPTDTGIQGCVIHGQETWVGDKMREFGGNS
jgi:hypothetical protein